MDQATIGKRESYVIMLQWNVQGIREKEEIVHMIDQYKEYNCSTGNKTVALL